MKKITLLLLCLLLLVLPACQSTGESTPTPQMPTSASPTQEAASTPTEIAPMPSAITQGTPRPADFGIDFGSYETVLDAENYTALSRFLPVLLEDASFYVGNAPLADESWVAQETTLDRFRKETASMAMYDDPPKISSFSLCDMDQDGEQELILAFNDSAKTFLILHQSEDKIQGVVMYTREFQMLQTNGIYRGTGGAATNEYQRMTFEDDSVQVNVLAREDSVLGEQNFWIGGEKTTYLEYNRWLEDNLPGEAIWYS